MVMTEDMEGGRPVSAHSPLRAASKKGDAKYNTSLCALALIELLPLRNTEQRVPECGALDYDLDGAGEPAVLCERLIELDRFVVVVDFEFGDNIVTLALFK